MAQYKYFVFIVLTCFLLALSKEARCDSADQHMLDDCKQTLHLCNDAVQADEDLIRAQSSVIDSQSQYISGLEKELKSQSSILPWYGWTAIGILTGAAVVGVLK